MREFSINSSYLDNLRIAVNNIPCVNEQKCQIILNGTYTIELPTVIAASISNPIAKIIESDPTANKFHFNIPIHGKNNNCLEKIKSVLQNNQTVTIENENDANVFASFGLKFGNNDFISPLSEKCQKKLETLNEENVFSNLEIKRIFGIKDISIEAEFIATNFQELSQKKSFISFASRKENIETIESVVKSKSLKVDKEDTLLAFLIAINRENAHDSRFVSLFDHVFLEYCSPQRCEQFLSFVHERSYTQEMRTLISCIGRRLIQPIHQLDQPFIEGRHKSRGTEITNEDPLNGILRREYEKGNVKMNASSTCSGSVYDLIKANPDADFITRNIENSSVTASLNDDTTFILTSYTIRGRKYDKNSSHLQSWRIEGQKSSNGEWIALDHHTNEPFDKLLLKNFDISCKEPLKAVRLIQEGKTTYDNYNLCINAFEVFGILFNQENDE